jgi:hypothetical protein
MDHTGCHQLVFCELQKITFVNSANPTARRGFALRRRGAADGGDVTLIVGLSLPGVILVTWTIPAVINWIFYCNIT